MKLVKFSILALAIGTFATSCTSTTEENNVISTDSTVIAPEATAPMVVDTTVAAPAVDSMATATPDGATNTMSTTTTTTEVTK